MPTAPAYPDEFRRPAVERIVAEKLPIADAARRLGVDATTRGPRLRATHDVKFAVVHTHREAWPVAAMCRVLGVTRGGYYAHRNRPASARTPRRADRAADVRAAVTSAREGFGRPRRARARPARGGRCGENTVAQVMRAEGRSAVRRRRGRPPQRPAVAAGDPPHRLNREFHTPTPNTKWTRDIPDVGTIAGWGSVAVRIALFRRRVVGWAVSESPDAALVGRAFRSAVTRRRPPAGVLIHSDRGCQDPRADYPAVVAEAEAVPRVRRTGNGWDNAPTESVFASLTKERWYRRSFADADDAARAVCEYIEVFSNRERRHSSLGDG